MNVEADPPAAPDAILVRQRWIPRGRRDWALASDRIMMEHGAVFGTSVYSQRHHARWRAQSLIRLMVELRLHERWQLAEHVERRDGGWIWSVEYKGRD